MNAIGVDVGGTKIAAAAVSNGGRVLNEVRYPTRMQPPQHLLETISQAIMEVSKGLEIGGACIAVPGLIEHAQSTVVCAPNLGEIENVRLDKEIGCRTGLSISVENDANAAAWGEFTYGSCTDVAHLIFITLGTGVGAGVVTHNILLRGSNGAGGEFGHVMVHPEGPLCGCGNYGCLEAMASGTALERRAREIANERPNSGLGRLSTKRQVIGEDVTNLASIGDEAARHVLHEVGSWLGRGLAGFVNVFNPEVVAIGGGACMAGEMLLRPAQEEVYSKARSPSRDNVLIRAAALGPQSGVLGAAALARDHNGDYVLEHCGNTTCSGKSIGRTPQT